MNAPEQFNVIQGLDRYTRADNKPFIQWAQHAVPRMSFRETIEMYEFVACDERVQDATRAALGLIDRMFLLAVILKRKDALHPWLFERCREVEAQPDGMLDLWAREHFKSTLITFAGSIQVLLRNPEETIGIFSHTRPVAKAFLRQIKAELEQNETLKALYADVLWADPRKQAPKWNEDDGIVIRRATNPKEASVEAWGLVDGQPTGKHFSLPIYDDVVTLSSVTNPEMIAKVTDAWALSLNLGAHGGRRWHIGTRYHQNDTYATMIERESVTPRIYPATDDGTDGGRPVFLSEESLHKKRRDMGPYVFAAQMLQRPTADKAQGFREEWLRYWEPRAWHGMNRYLLVDPASKKKKTSDYTVMVVVGLASDGNYYTIDWIRDRMNLAERTRNVFMLHKKYRPLATGYEEYGAQADVEHIEYVQEQENYRFPITRLGGPLAKEDRIRRLVPIYESGRMYLPDGLRYVDFQQHAYDPTVQFVRDEFLSFPVCAHDDMLDVQSRILDPDLQVIWPETDVPATDEPEWMRRLNVAPTGNWKTR